MTVHSSLVSKSKSTGHVVIEIAGCQYHVINMDSASRLCAEGWSTISGYPVNVNSGVYVHTCVLCGSNSIHMSAPV